MVCWYEEREVVMLPTALESVLLLCTLVLHFLARRLSMAVSVSAAVMSAIQNCLSVVEADVMLEMVSGSRRC